ncbi:MAG: hypothetical protein HY861_04775 [Chlamydiia bacterium]|nr:hypothetical protein [Chlamydiia bacterium]
MAAIDLNKSLVNDRYYGALKFFLVYNDVHQTLKTHYTTEAPQWHQSMQNAQIDLHIQECNRLLSQSEDDTFLEEAGVATQQFRWFVETNKTLNATQEKIQVFVKNCELGINFLQTQPVPLFFTGKNTTTACPEQTLLGYLAQIDLWKDKATVTLSNVRSVLGSLGTLETRMKKHFPKLVTQLNRDQNK